MVTATDVMLEHGISLGVSLGEVQEETSFVARDRFFFKFNFAFGDVWSHPPPQSGGAFAT